MESTGGKGSLGPLDDVQFEADFHPDAYNFGILWPIKIIEQNKWSILVCDNNNALVQIPLCLMWIRAFSPLTTHTTPGNIDLI